METTTPAKVLVTAIRKLKTEVRLAVDVALREFETETGLSPSAIDVHLEDITTHGDTERHGIVADVRIELRDL